MQTAQTQHKVSQFLQDRHPFIEEQKSEKLEVSSAYGRRGIGKFVTILTDPAQSDDEVAAALKELLGLMTTQEKKLEALKAGAVQACCQLVPSKDASSTVKARAGQLLGSLAMVMAGRTAIKKHKATVLLTEATLDSHAEVRTAASQALTHMTKFRDGWSIVIDTPKAVKNLVASLDGHDGSAAVFANLTSFYDEGCIATLKAGVMGKLVALIRDTPDLEMRKLGLMALRNLLNNDGGKERAIRYGAVDAVAQHLRSSDASVRLAAAGCIQNICVNQDAKPMVLDAEDAVDALASLLRDENADVRHNATVAIRCVSELPRAKGEFVAALVHQLDLIQSVYGSSACGPLCELLESKEAEVRNSAAFAVASFANNPKERQAVIMQLHMVRRLAQVFSEEALPTPTRRELGKALQALCTAYPDAKREFSQFVAQDATGAASRVLVGFPSLAAVVAN